MSGINSNMDETTLLREMRKMGINPSHLKIDHNTVTH